MALSLSRQMRLGLGSGPRAAAAASKFESSQYSIFAEDWSGTGNLAPRTGTGDTTLTNATLISSRIRMNGTSAFAQLPAAALPDLSTSADSMVLLAFVKNAAGDNGRLVSGKDSTTGNSAGFEVVAQATGSPIRARVGSGAATTVVDRDLTTSAVEVVLCHFDFANDEFAAYSTTSGSFLSTAWANSSTPATVTAPRIGSRADFGGSFAEMDLIAYAMWDGLSRADALLAAGELE